MNTGQPALTQRQRIALGLARNALRDEKTGGETPADDIRWRITLRIALETVTAAFPEGSE